MKNNNIEELFQMPPLVLVNWLLKNIPNQIPEEISTKADMEQASKCMLKLSGYYSYLMTLQSYAKVKTRQAKRTLPKEEYEDMVDKKDIINNYTDAVKQSYAAISRAVTIYIENNNEIRMGKETP